MAYNKGFNPDRLPMHAEPEQVLPRVAENALDAD
jgi:hypothetical protein